MEFTNTADKGSGKLRAPVICPHVQVGASATAWRGVVLTFEMPLPVIRCTFFPLSPPHQNDKGKSLLTQR